MNTETKTRHSEIVNEIKQQVFRITQENDVLRNCWEKEQGENEQQRHRIRLLLEENALLRNQIRYCIEENHDLKCQVEDLLTRNVAEVFGLV